MIKKCNHKPQHYYQQITTLVNGEKWIECTKCHELLEKISNGDWSIEEMQNKIKKDYRIEELEEKRTEFIINESVFEDENPSWSECFEANNKAEQLWNETDDGKELAKLLTEMEN